MSHLYSSFFNSVYLGSIHSSCFISVSLLSIHLLHLTQGAPPRCFSSRRCRSSSSRCRRSLVGHWSSRCSDCRDSGRTEQGVREATAHGTGRRQDGRLVWASGVGNAERRREKVVALFDRRVHVFDSIIQKSLLLFIPCICRSFVPHQCIICVYVHAYVWGMRLSIAVGRSGPVVAVGATDVIG